MRGGEETSHPTLVVFFLGSVVDCVTLSLSLRLEGFFLLEIGRSCSKRGLKNIHRPKIVDWCVRAPSTSSSRCASTRREKIRFFFVLLSSRGKVGKQFLPRNNKLSCFRLYVSIKILFFFFFYKSFLLWRDFSFLDPRSTDVIDGFFQLWKNFEPL